MPASTDLYFPPEDSAFEVEHMPNAELRVCRDRLGPFRRRPAAPARTTSRFDDAAIKELLAS